MISPVEPKVFLCGEGKHELGTRAGDPVYQSDEGPGVLVALLRRIKPDGWSVGSAREWKSYRRFQAHGPSHGDGVTVRKIALDAAEYGCSIAAFLRDQNGDPSRKKQIDEAIAKLHVEGELNVALAGAVVIPAIEAWMLALRGEHKTEAMSRSQAANRLAALIKPNEVTTSAMVEIVENVDSSLIPDDAHSLLEWRRRAEESFFPEANPEAST